MRLHSVKSGFTLIEVVVVIVIMSIALGLVGISFARSQPTRQLDATARDVMAAFKQVRIHAAQSGEPAALIVNLDSRQYGPAGKTPRLLPDAVIIEVTDPLEGTISRGHYRFVFYPGGAVEGGSLMLAAGRKRVMIAADPIVGARHTRLDE